MDKALSYITIITMIAMTLLILIQSRGASLGAGFGGSGEIHTTRRGVDKSIHNLTVILSIVFVLSIALGLVVG